MKEKAMVKFVVEVSSLDSLRNEFVVWLEEQVKEYTSRQQRSPGRTNNFKAIADEFEKASSFWRLVEIREVKRNE